LSLKPDTENNANFDAVSSKRGNFDAKVTPFSKEVKILIKNLCECKGYNAQQSYTVSKLVHFFEKQCSSVLSCGSAS